MATAHLPRPHGRAALDSLREAFWVFALGLMVCFTFFVALGAFDLTESTGVAIGFGVLCAMWIVHVLMLARHKDDERDPRLIHDRERRGF